MIVTRKTWAGIGCGAAAGALWGGVFLGPELAHDFAPHQLAIARYLVYGAVSAALIAPRWRAVTATLGRAEWWTLIWISFIGNIVYFTLLGAGVQLGGVAMTSLVIGFLPVTVTLIGSRDRGAVPLSRLIPSLILGVAAIVCIAWDSPPTIAPEDRPARLLGVLCALGALACWTAFAVANARWLAKLGHISGHDWNLLGGVTTGTLALLCAGPAFLIAAAPHTGDAWLRFAGVAAGMAVGASIVGNMFWNWASRFLPLTLIGQMILFETLFALLYGFLWENRWPTSLETAAMTLMVASVITCVSAHRPPADPQPPVHPETL